MSLGSTVSRARQNRFPAESLAIKVDQPVPAADRRPRGEGRSARTEAGHRADRPAGSSTGRWSAPTGAGGGVDGGRTPVVRGGRCGTRVRGIALLVRGAPSPGPRAGVAAGLMAPLPAWSCPWAAAAGPLSCDAADVARSSGPPSHRGCHGPDARGDAAGSPAGEPSAGSGRARRPGAGMPPCRRPRPRPGPRPAAQARRTASVDVRAGSDIRDDQPGGHPTGRRRDGHLDHRGEGGAGAHPAVPGPQPDLADDHPDQVRDRRRDGQAGNHPVRRAGGCRRSAAALRTTTMIRLIRVGVRASFIA